MFDLEGVKEELKMKLEDYDVYGADYELLKGQVEEMIDGVGEENVVDLLKVWQWVIHNDLEDQLYNSGIYEMINDTVIKGLLIMIDKFREESFDLARKLSLK
jgi:hypothetical protein